MGILVIHFGLIFLVVGEIITGISSVESQMPLNVGEVSNFSNSFREMELVIIDESDEELEQVIAIPQSLLVTGKSYDLPHSPLKIKIKQAYANSHLERLQEAQSSLANQGVGTRVFARALPAVTKDDRLNTLSAYVEILNKDDSSIGTWLLSNAIPEAQSFSHYKIQIRQQRHYHPFSLQLNEFIHTKHPGTNIPESFASQVTLFNADGEFERSVLISMNQPLYYQGKTFYQASYGENDTLSVLQVVDNPVKAAPYISSALVSAGLLIQFLTSFFSFARRR
jgi:cytochrome c biogenesis protein ResB